MVNYIINLENVSMRFNMSIEKIDSFKEYIIKLAKRKLSYKEFWALKDISIKVKKGEVFGIIGLNGAGKSTLLKIMAAVLKPTEGKVAINGSMAPLIELGAGFDQELTGRENIFLNGAVLGYTKKEMLKKVDEIVEFSELEEFMDTPIKNFSSGMYARLGFAIATIVNPDILIVDEILSVGDIHFKQKCEDRIRKILENGTTVILVSHDLNQVESMCNRVLWLEHGKMVKVGDAKTICEEFRNAVEGDEINV